jgi:protein O-GlcNAc transferase
MTDAFFRGQQLEQAGELPGAEREYREALLESPSSVTILFRLGVVCLKQRKLENAMRYLSQVTELDPNFAEAWSNLGIAVASHGSPAKAENAFRQAVALSPGRPDLYRNLANSLIATGNRDEALLCLRKSLEMDPANIAALLSTAKLAADLGELAEATNCLQRILVLEPQHQQAATILQLVQKMPRQVSRTGGNEQQAPVDRASFRAAVDRGMSHASVKQFESALSEFRLATQINPSSAEAFAYLGSTQIELKRDAEAIESLHASLRNCSGQAPLYLNLGGAYERLGNPETAIKYFQAAIQCDSMYEKAYLNLGRILASQRKLDEAIQCISQAIQISPSSYDAYYHLGIVHYLRSDSEAAVQAFRQALRYNVQDANGFAMLASSLVNQGKLADAVSAANQALRVQPLHEGALSTFIHQSQHMCQWDELERLSQRVVGLIADGASFHDTNPLSEPFSPFTFVALPVATTPEQQLKCARRYVDLRSSAPKPSLRAPHRSSNQQQITVGYLSADFREHPVAYLIAGLFEAHDRNRFKVIGYSYGDDDQSEIRGRIQRGFDRFVELRNSSDWEAAQKIAADQVDILVDLTGHTRGWRLDILAHRPAPLIVHYLGYPGTTGSPFIDYLLVDEFVVPHEQRLSFSEQLVYMPGCFLVNDCHHRIGPVHVSRSECGLPEEAFVYCCFNAGYKITSHVFDIWMRLLRAAPSAVLWLKDTNQYAKANLLREAQQRGVESKRLVFAPRSDTLQEHIARYRLADLFLDTFPYNAHTTASDSLLAGCPVVTYAGDAFSSRVAGSLLRAVGLPELVANTWEDYESIALDLSLSRKKCGELRARLDKNRERSDLFKMDVFARKIESAYEQMWQIHLAGDPPRSFRVDQAPMKLPSSSYRTNAK